MRNYVIKFYLYTLRGDVYLSIRLLLLAVRQEEMLTLEYCRSTSMFFDPELLPVMEPATDAVLLAARFVLGLSSSLGK
jgi:hypothetical protein